MYNDLTIDIVTDYSTQLLNQDLIEVGSLYPNFSSWLNKFYKELNSDRRKLLVAYLNERAVGYALLKTTKEESKICTFFVVSAYRGTGIGSILLDRVLEVLNSDKTFITVPDERLNEMTPLLSKKGFEITSSVENMYRKGSTEHFWTLKKN